MADQWKIAEDEAARNGQTMRREEWRLVLPIHIAETREQALDDVREGYAEWQAGYFQDTLGQPGGEGSTDIEAVANRGGAIVGTPDDAIDAIHRLDELSGGFGGVLGMAHECANREKTLHSYELWARYVAPHFQGSADSTRASREWVRGNRLSIFAPRQSAVLKAFDDAGIAVPEGVRDRMYRGAAAIGDETLAERSKETPPAG
jgi:limonene 1,2-monooxygenase